MENEATLVATLFEKVEQYGKTSAELLKLKTIGKTADAASSLVASLAVMVFIALFVLMASIGAALWISEFLTNSCAGFFIVSGAYLLISGIVYVFRKQLIKMPVNNATITQVLKN